MVSRSKAGYNFRCYYYKPDYEENIRLNRDAKIEGIIYLKKTNEIIANSFVGSTKTTEVILETRTPDFIDDLKIDYFILLEGYIYRVSGMGSIGDIDDQGRKDYSVTLKRVGDAPDEIGRAHV